MVGKEIKVHYVLIMCQDDVLHAIIASKTGAFKNILLGKNVGNMSHQYFGPFFPEVRFLYLFFVLLFRKD